MRDALLLSALLMVGCADREPEVDEAMNTPPTDDRALDVERLTGTSWVFETVAGDALPDRANVTMAFDREANRVYGRAACNNYTAGFTVEAGRFEVTQAASTKMACPDALMQAEERFLAALQGAVAFEIDEAGRLVLIGADGARSRAVAESSNR